MELERGRVVEIVVSVAAVASFVAVLITIGWRFNRDGMGPDGGLALVAAITLFILAMAAIGYGIASSSYED